MYDPWLENPEQPADDDNEGGDADEGGEAEPVPDLLEGLTAAACGSSPSKSSTACDISWQTQQAIQVSLWPRHTG